MDVDLISVPLELQELWEEWPLLAKEKRRIAADTMGINPPLC
jgi:hypothetical protein